MQTTTLYIVEMALSVSNVSFMRSVLCGFHCYLPGAEADILGVAMSIGSDLLCEKLASKDPFFFQL